MNAQKIVLSGVVSGDAHLAGERIELGPTAKLSTALSYASAAGLKQASAAYIGGATTHEALPCQRVVGATALPRRSLHQAAEPQVCQGAGGRDDVGDDSVGAAGVVHLSHHVRRRQAHHCHRHRAVLKQ